MKLADQTCEPCSGRIAPLTRQQFQDNLQELNDWQVENDKILQKTIKTEDFKKALELANKIGAIAEEQNHHPDLLVRWGELKISLFTHKIDGLSTADFVLAAKIDQLLADIK